MFLMKHGFILKDLIPSKIIDTGRLLIQEVLLNDVTIGMWYAVTAKRIMGPRSTRKQLIMIGM